QQNKVFVTGKGHKQAKKAILEYDVLAEREGMSMLEITLHTGRSHQIRVQLATIACPLYGDQKYGDHVNQVGQQIALWAHSLAFPHPTKEDMVEIDADSPNTYPWNLFG